MDGADILGIVALAVAGGAGAYVTWYVSRFGFGGDPAAGSRRTRSGTGGLRPSSAVAVTQDPRLEAEIAALRAEVAAIAATQARMLKEQSDREGMLLAEMRAVASVMDPKIVESLARIESSVGSNLALAPEPEAKDDPEPPRDTDRLYVVPDEREEAPTPSGEGGKTIRRG